MFTLSKIYGTLTRQRLVKDRDVQEFVDASFNDSSDDTDTDDDGGDNDNDGGDSDNDGGDNDNDGGDSDNDGGDNDNDGGDNDNHNDNDDDDAAESNPSPHSPHSFTRSGGNSRNDSGIPFEVPSRWCRGEAVTRLSLAKNPSSRHGMKATEPFPDIDPLVLAIGIHEFDDPPNLQGLEINNVEIYLGRLRDDPVFGYREACAGNVISSAGDDTDDASAQVLDTSVDFTSTCVSRSSSSTMSTMSVKDSRHKKVAQSGSKQESKVPKDTSHSPVKDSRKLSNSMTLDDTVGPRYQLPDKNMEDYMQRVSARVHAVLAKQDGEKRIDSPVSSSASSNEDFDTSEELTFNDNDTCPSSPTTPFTPRTPLNHRNLSKLVTPPTISEIEEDEPQPAAAKTLEWAPPPITGPPIFNLNKTRLTPPRSENKTASNVPSKISLVMTTTPVANVANALATHPIVSVNADWLPGN
ncbi:hypothetical protein E2P81_ATG08990 [Venturia nashicola]|nr:hypothetical protein E2P81_ATG08990 [Venturia nashicola]